MVNKIERLFQDGPEEYSCDWIKAENERFRRREWEAKYNPDYAAAEDKDTSPSDLAKLSKSQSPAVRENVASNISTSEELLDELANDGDKWVRCCVAKNPSTSPETLDRLGNDDVGEVRYQVAGNSDTLEDTYQRLIEDEASDICLNVGRNPDAPDRIRIQIYACTGWPPGDLDDISFDPEIIDELWNDADARVRRGVANYPRTKTEILDNLASDTDDEVRFYVASNSQTSLSTVTGLCSDSSPKVQRVAMDERGRRLSENLYKISHPQSSED
ncbi:MAG: hypothetical protein FWD64_03715 [Acidobacteriaceae bacterium]|nr:hypothetical protein [Acidobacteriaceae bacterium]